MQINTLLKTNYLPENIAEQDFFKAPPMRSQDEDGNEIFSESIFSQSFTSDPSNCYRFSQAPDFNLDNLEMIMEDDATQEESNLPQP